MHARNHSVAEWHELLGRLGVLRGELPVLGSGDAERGVESALERDNGLGAGAASAERSDEAARVVDKRHGDQA